MIEPATFQIDDAHVPALRAVLTRLARLGYNEHLVRDRLGLDDIDDLRWRALPIYRDERLAERDPLALAIDLFLLQGAVSGVELDRLFDLSEQETLLRTGLVALDTDGCTRARASLFPVGDCLVFSDHAWPKLPHPGCAEVPYDQVMFVGADSRWLARTTVRRPVGSALDLCTGSGVQALLAASHARRVLAVDINERAGSCARFNAKAIGAEHMEIAVGDLYQPVGHERFDLITANPPFVPSPVNSLGFRDGGRSGEEVQRRIVAGLPKHLAGEGTMLMVTELGERENESLADRVREWLCGAPMDLLILRLAEHTAAHYAIGHAQGDYDFGEFLDSVQDWAANLREQGYVRVVSVILAFQWSDSASGPPWARVETLPAPQRDAGAEVEALFTAERLARRHDLGEILERSRVRRSGAIGLMESRLLGGDLRTNVRAQLLGRSLTVGQWLDPVEYEILAMMEATMDVPEVVARAGRLGQDKEAVFAALASLLRRGLVLLAGDRQ